MKKFLIPLLFLATPLTLMGASKTVVVDNTTGILSAPTNFLNTNFLSGNTLYVDKLGSDTTARRTTSKPFLTPWAAASNQFQGDVIKGRAGNYVMPSIEAGIKLTNNGHFFGEPGFEVTLTNGSAAVGMIFPGTNSLIQNVYFRAYVPVGDLTGIQKIITTSLSAGSKFWQNATFKSCTFEGETDIYAVAGTTPVSTYFRECYMNGFWDAFVTSASPNYGQYDNCVVYMNAAPRKALDPDLVSVDWSSTILKTSGGSTNIFNNCVLIATNTGINTLWADIPGEMGAFIVRDTSGSGYHTNWTVFNNCTFGCAGTNAPFTNFSSSMFSGPTTNAWVNSNHVILFNGALPQTVYPPSYGMFEANTYCANWGDGYIQAPNASTRIVRLPNAGPNGKPFFRGERLCIIDSGSTATGTNISVTTRGGQTINGQASTNIVLNNGRLLLEVGGVGNTNWIVVDASSSGGSGSSSGQATNAPPQIVAINEGLGTSNILINMLALGPTNTIRATLTGNIGMMVTNVVDGKDIVLELYQDSTGQRTWTTNATWGFNIRFGRESTGAYIDTNATWVTLWKIHGCKTNAQFVGYSSGFAP